MSQERTNKGRPLPPAKNRWKKGESGNPLGRPKKQENLTLLLQKEVQKICPADRAKRTYGALVVQATLRLAMKGNAAALNEVWNRLDGKVLQKGTVQLGRADGKAIKIEVVYVDHDNGGSKSR